MSDTVHVVPISDLVEHDTDGGECVCGPTVEPVERDDGSIGWLVIHHSLDGRELAVLWAGEDECPASELGRDNVSREPSLPAAAGKLPPAGVIHAANLADANGCKR